jgi:serine/threonine-protein kinase
VLAVVVAVLLVLGVGGAVWYITSGQFTQVPAVLRQSQTDATERLESAGLDVDVKKAYSDTVERGRVISTDPAPGERIRDNDSVTVTVSKGPETVKVPDLKGLRLDLAKDRLSSDGLEPGLVTREFSDEVVRGQVISTRPGIGTEVSSGTVVRIVVSRGAPVDVPDLSGASVEDARAQLEAEGLKVKIASGRVNSEFEKGLVAEQSPGVGKQVGTGDTVTLTLSKGPVLVEVPDVVGDSVDEATSRLKAAGFEVEEDRGILGFFADEVKGQSVDGGDTAPKGSKITIEIG